MLARIEPADREPDEADGRGQEPDPCEGTQAPGQIAQRRAPGSPEAVPTQPT